MPFKTEEDHLSNIGQMIEQMENFVRSNLDTLYLSKNEETVDGIRTLPPQAKSARRAVQPSSPSC